MTSTWLPKAGGGILDCDINKCDDNDDEDEDENTGAVQKLKWVRVGGTGGAATLMHWQPLDTE